MIASGLLNFCRCCPLRFKGIIAKLQSFLSVSPLKSILCLVCIIFTAAYACSC